MPSKKKSEITDKKDIKTCPYCANEIKAGAKKCMYCKESLVEKKEFDNEDREIIQEKNKTKRIWGWILTLSIPIIGVIWLIISMIFWLINTNSGGSEMLMIIQMSLNRILGILVLFSFFFTIRGIVILCKSYSKSDGVLHDGEEIDSENIKSSIKLANLTKGFICGYLIRTIIDFLGLPRYIELLGGVLTIGIFILQIVWGFITYKGLQTAKIGGLSFPKGRGRLVFGWICPIANLFMPYQIVRDVMNAYKLKTGKSIILSFFGTIVGRRWFVNLVNGFISGIILSGTGEGSIVLTMLSRILDIIGYTLLVVVLTKIQKMQKEYMMNR